MLKFLSVYLSKTLSYYYLLKSFDHQKCCPYLNCLWSFVFPELFQPCQDLWRSSVSLDWCPWPEIKSFKVATSSWCPWESTSSSKLMPSIGKSWLYIAKRSSVSSVIIMLQSSTLRVSCSVGIIPAQNSIGQLLNILYHFYFPLSPWPLSLWRDTV